MRRNHLNLVSNAKVAPQHRVLVMDLRLDIGQHRRPPTTGPAHIKWWKLPRYKGHLKARLDQLDINLSQPVKTIWDNITEQIQTTANDVLGQTKRGTRFIEKQVWWWDEEVQKIVKEKKAAFKNWRQSLADTNYQHYKLCKSAAKRAVATAKSAHYDQLYADLDTPEGANKIYRLANARHRSTQDIGQIKSIKDDDHQVLREPPTILRRWSEYFSGISNQEFPHPPIESAAPVFGPVPPITPAEVELAMKKMKNCKAAGLDDIPVEVWKLLGRQGTDILAVLFNKIVDTGEVPSAWSTSVTVPIWKNKGDVTECSNYRPICLLCHTMKIFKRTIDARLRKIVTITPNQCGFVQRSGTTDAIHAAHILLEKHREKNQTIHMAFLDLEKAFDRVPHDLIWHSLRSHGVPEAYVECIKLLYKGITSAVRCAAGLSPPFPINVGVHQGSALSPLLFILCMDTITAVQQSPHPWSLLFADDVFLASETRAVTQRDTQLWKDRLDEYGLRLNIKKTEIKEDLKIVNASPEDALDRLKWRRLCQRADPAITGATPG
ncbi:putative RNA-directed DNA polymerase from transposon X-element [Anabarilius grahami]|uniref:ribonuclease H n=1 Tax=Anabarilius grahami TaxID=495550 RepID=A0A3N0XJM4_ANAGA|nr:putative RNA-directed DNA polymerase from transposon X-element [Anabarilius grahami]